MNLAVNDNRFGFHLCLDVGVFGDGERAVRGDFPFDTSVNEEVVGELNGTIDVDVVAENVALSACSGCAG